MPTELSGGQTHRTGIARALAAKPQRVIRDAVVVMQHVLVVEPRPNAALFAAPKAGYTNLALPSVPELDPDWLNHLLAVRGEHA